MPSPNTTFDAIATTTIEHRSKTLCDSATENNALLMRLSERGNVKTVSGGDQIVEPILYPGNDTYKRYSGYELLNISPTQVVTGAAFQWKQAAVAITMSGLEELQNSGPEQIIDLLEAKVKGAEAAMKNGISADIYSDGTADGGKQIGGLQLLLADANTTGTVGGIDRASYTWWRHQVFDASSDGGAPTTSANIIEYLSRLYMKLVRGTDKPDLLVLDNNYFGLFLTAMQGKQMLVNAKLAEAGFETVKFMGMDVVLDGGYGGDAPASHAYMLNTNYINWRPHKNRNFAPLKPDRFATNQDAFVRLIGFAGNLTMCAAFGHGVMKE